VDEHIGTWKKQKEMTSLEPSGLSFSHYKAASVYQLINKLPGALQVRNPQGE
jgi:hypothetical protein